VLILLGARSKAARSNQKRKKGVGEKEVGAGDFFTEKLKANIERGKDANQRGEEISGSTYRGLGGHRPKKGALKTAGRGTWLGTRRGGKAEARRRSLSSLCV